MRYSRASSLAVAVVGLLVVAACTEAVVARGGSFKTQYLAARSALEAGKYDRAIAGYQALLQDAGVMEPRVRLEYSHSLLRTDRYLEASQQARIVSQSNDVSTRLAALAVAGTAEHELALGALARGERGAAVKAQLTSAAAAFDLVLKQASVFDPLGVLAERRSGIAASLKSL